MTILLDANPAVSPEWPRWDENADGVLDAQVEAYAVREQFTVVVTGAIAPAFRFLVRPGDRYGTSTGYRVLARAWPAATEGDTDAFRLEFVLPGPIPAGVGWVTLLEFHGPARVVAPVRYNLKPRDARSCTLTVSYNAGTLNAAGGGSDWTPERPVGVIEYGKRTVLEGVVRWDPDRGEGRLAAWLDEVIAHDEQHATAQRSTAGAYLKPYVLVGLYVGDTLTAPLELLVRRFVWGDTLREVRATANATPPTQPPPAGITLEQRVAGLETGLSLALERLDGHDGQLAALAVGAGTTRDLATRVDERLVELAALVDARTDGAGSKLETAAHALEDTANELQRAARRLRGEADA